MKDIMREFDERFVDVHFETGGLIDVFTDCKPSEVKTFLKEALEEQEKKTRLATWKVAHDQYRFDLKMELESQRLKEEEFIKICESNAVGAKIAKDIYKAILSLQTKGGGDD